MAGGISVATTTNGTGVVARLSGTMDHTTDPDLTEKLTELVAGHHRCVLDLSGVTFWDSAGLNVLLTAWTQANRHGTQLVLACAPDRVRRILEITGADQVLPVYDTLAQAEAALGDTRGQGR